MKCQDFELVVQDLVRVWGTTSDARSDALAHAGECERCAARLADERALSSDLRAVAARTAVAAPPPGAEAALLAAFRALEPVPAVAPLAPRRARGVTAALAAAAALAWIAVGVVGYRSATWSAAPEPLPPRVVTAVPLVENPKSIDAQPSGGSVDVHSNVTTSAPRAVASRDRFRRDGAVAPRGAADPAARAEVVTDYFPLVAASDLSPSDGGQIVRVELPRSALAPLGFQITSTRSDRPITADVLLGNDGVARAIRFVQTSDTNGRR